MNWLRVYSTLCVEDFRYIPESVYYGIVEPILNNKTYRDAYNDKNMYHKSFPHELLPQIYLRCIEAELYDQNYMANSEFKLNDLADILACFIVKPTQDTGGGRSILLVHHSNNKWMSKDSIEITLEYLGLVYGGNYIIQEYIQQHSFYKKFNESSVNTIRILTYRSVISNNVIALHTVLRIGQPGSIVDNQASGGIAVGVNNNGDLTSYGVSKNGKIVTEKDGIVFKNVGQLLAVKKMIQIAKELAPGFYYHRLLGFDFCLDKHGNIKLIEINNGNNEINFYQMNNGPLFGDFTNEVVTYCENHRKSFCIDFKI